MELTSQLAYTACSRRISTGPLNMDNMFLHTAGKGIIQVSKNKLVWNIIGQSLEYCCGISQIERHDNMLKMAKRELKSGLPFISFPHSQKILDIGKKLAPCSGSKAEVNSGKEFYLFSLLYCSNFESQKCLFLLFPPRNIQHLEDWKTTGWYQLSGIPWHIFFQCLLFWTRQIVETAPGSCSVESSKWQYGGKQAAKSLLTTLSVSW